ncbi:MAG: glycosyl hydrolase family 28 protein [Tepidisphaeraceae bacterium]
MTTEEIVAAPPVIPPQTFLLTDFGAVGDGDTFDTDAFKKAVNAIAKAGGGHLIVPAGTYLTKSFTLVSHMDLHLERGATIQAPTRYSDYGLPDPGKRPATRPVGARGFAFARLPALISASKVTDVSITGSGTIDGSGGMFWLFASQAARRYLPNSMQYPRPVLIAIHGDRLLFDGVTLTNSPMFHLTPSGNDILIENLHIVAPSDSPNTDAMDLRGQRIVVRHCEIDVGDDHVEIGGPCKDILVEDLTCLHGHGISIGSPTRGGVSHVIVRRCTFDSSENAIRIKSARGRGGLIEDVTYSDISIKNITKMPIDITMLYSGEREPDPDGDFTDIPQVRNVRLSNITITGCHRVGRIVGLPEQLATDITLENVNATTDQGVYVQDATNIFFKNVQMDIAVGKPIITDNGKVTVTP